MKIAIVSMFFLISGIVSTAQSAAVSIGKVDIQKVMLSIAEGKKVRKRLEGMFNKKKDELKKAEDTIRKEQQDYQKQTSLLSEKAKRQKEQSIQKKIVELQQKTVTYQKEIHQLEKELKKPILDKIKPIIETVSKSKKLNVTFEVSATPIVYAEKEVDITAEVIKAYDKAHPAKK